MKNPLYGTYKIQTDYFNNKKHLKWPNMETKKHTNWDKFWQIIHRIITAILAAETAARNI